MRQRYYILDEIRGITLCSMIVYHTVWDLVYLFGMDWSWYRSEAAYIWQQSICWSFILLSGFCFSLGKKKWKRGLTVFGAGIVISLVTEIFMPDNRVRFGVLTLLGSSMLVLALAEYIRKKYLSGKEFNISPLWGTAVSFGLFGITKRINYGYLGFADVKLAELPKNWYQMGDFGSFLGFTESSFYSTDYFSLLPWFFLFLTGYYLNQWFVKKDWIARLASVPSLGRIWRPLGKHSLLLYLLHQPIVYAVLIVIM